MAKLFSYTWSLGLVVCKVSHYTEPLSVLCSTLNLTALAVERLVVEGSVQVLHKPVSLK